MERNKSKLTTEEIKQFVQANPDARFTFEDGYGVYSPKSGASAGINGNAFNAFKRTTKLTANSTIPGRTFWTVA